MARGSRLRFCFFDQIRDIDAPLHKTILKVENRILYL